MVVVKCDGQCLETTIFWIVSKIKRLKPIPTKTNLFIGTAPETCLSSTMTPQWDFFLNNLAHLGNNVTYFQIFT